MVIQGSIIALGMAVRNVPWRYVRRLLPSRSPHLGGADDPSSAEDARPITLLVAAGRVENAHVHTAQMWGRGGRDDQ
jgi:hypothetical protein